nr:uncharacterized protein LOC113460297 [Zonotrichia albicollis]
MLALGGGGGGGGGRLQNGIPVLQRCWEQGTNALTPVAFTCPLLLVLGQWEIPGFGEELLLQAFVIGIINIPWMAGDSLLPWNPPMICSQPCVPVGAPHPSCPAEAPTDLSQEVPSIAMLEILRKSLKCSIFPGLQAAGGEKCFLGFRIGANCPWDGAVHGMRCGDVCWGSREPEEVLILKDQYCQQEPGTSLPGTIESGKSIQPRETRAGAASCRPKVLRTRVRVLGLQLEQEPLALGQSSCCCSGISAGLGHWIPVHPTTFLPWPHLSTTCRATTPLPVTWGLHCVPCTLHPVNSISHPFIPHSTPLNAHPSPQTPYPTPSSPIPHP